MNNDRNKFIGASDVAPILGLSPFTTPVDVWHEKTGRADKFKANEAMHWGNMLEAVVAREFGSRNKCELRDPQREYADGIFRCHVDYMIQWDTGLSCPLEIKTTSAFTTPWNDKVPMHIELQVQTQMRLTNSNVAYIALLKGGQQYSEHTVDAWENARMSRILEALQHWWDRHIVRDVQPNATTPNDVAKLFPNSKPMKSVDIDIPTAKVLARLRIERDRMNSARDDAIVSESIIKEFMGDAETLLDENNAVVTWRSSKPIHKVNWEKLARNHVDDVKPFIEQYTSTRAGSRRFLVK